MQRAGLRIFKDIFAMWFLLFSMLCLFSIWNDCLFTMFAGGFRAEGDKNVPTKKAVFYILSPHFNILVKQFPFLRLSLLGQANNGPSNLTSNVFIQWVSKKNRSPWTRIHRCIPFQLKRYFFPFDWDNLFVTPYK